MGRVAIKRIPKAGGTALEAIGQEIPVTLVAHYDDDPLDDIAINVLCVSECILCMDEPRGALFACGQRSAAATAAVRSMACVLSAASLPSPFATSTRAWDSEISSSNVGMYPTVSLPGTAHKAHSIA